MVQLPVKSHKSQKQRLPKEKRMTICIGLLAQDGIVIAADAQETAGDYKRHEQKIFTFMGPIKSGGNPEPPTMACAFTGAGDAGYLDAFFAFALKDIDTGFNQLQLEAYLSQRIREFHEAHIFPLALSTACPEIQVLIGAFCGWQTTMFVTYGSTLRRVFPVAAVGIGAHFAKSLLSEMPVSCTRDLKHAELLAAYAIAATKEHIEGCGKYTSIYSLHNSTFVEGKDGAGGRLVRPEYPLTWVSQDKIRRWEQSFATTWIPRQSALIADLVEEELARESKPSNSRKSTGRR